MPNVADIEVGKTDALGQTVTCLYGRKSPIYAVYAANRRVMIGFADDGDQAQQQRKDMSSLAPLRGEIDGLVDGWREGTSRQPLGARHSPGLLSKANRYNRRVADALVVGLEGDVPTATAILTTIRQEIIDERTARARFEYLICAILTAIGLMFGAWLVTATYPLIGESDAARRAAGIGVTLLLLALIGAIGFGYSRLKTPRADDGDIVRTAGLEAGGTAAEPVPSTSAWYAGAIVPAILLFAVIAIPIVAMLLLSGVTRAYGHEYRTDYRDAVTLWRAAAAGSVGAFFSIAIGIRGRTVLPDLLRTSNLMDASLRVSIGFIGAAVLEALLREKAVELKLGDFVLADPELMGVMIAGFLAGFSERLVPDLLAKANATPGAQVPLPRPIAAPPPPPPPGGGGAGGGAGPASTGGPPPAGATDDASTDDESHEDGCASDHEITEDQLTDDRDLPVASGGVAKPDPDEVRP